MMHILQCTARSGTLSRNVALFVVLIYFTLVHTVVSKVIRPVDVDDRDSGDVDDMQLKRIETEPPLRVILSPGSKDVPTGFNASNVEHWEPEGDEPAYEDIVCVSYCDSLLSDEDYVVK